MPLLETAHAVVSEREWWVAPSPRQSLFSLNMMTSIVYSDVIDNNI
jgi:hypothetical protein